MTTKKWSEIRAAKGAPPIKRHIPAPSADWLAAGMPNICAGCARHLLVKPDGAYRHDPRDPL